MEAARFNVYWFLWLLAPAVLMLVATFRRRRWDLLLGVFLSLGATYALSNLAVVEKWRIRNEIAVTAAERAYAIGDGGNLTFTLLFFAPLEAIVLSTFWGLVGWLVWPCVRRFAGRRA